MESTLSTASRDDSTPSTALSTEVSGSGVTDRSGEDSASAQSVANEPTSKAAPKSQAKSKPVASRYMQSCRQWVDKRTETSGQTGNTSQGRTSRNPTPERRKKVSTPKTTEKTLNVSGVSVINKVDDKLVQLPDINKYGKPLIGRKSLAPRKLNYQSDGPTAGPSRSAPLSVRPESDDRRKEAEIAIADSINLQSVYLNLKAKEAQEARRVDALDKITRLWKLSNEVRKQTIEVQTYIVHMEDMVRQTATLEEEETKLSAYLTLRKQSDLLFNELAQLIDSQKRLIKLENCSETDFETFTKMAKEFVGSELLDTTDSSSENLANAETVLEEVSAIEDKLKEKFVTFSKCVAEIEKYRRIEAQLKNEKLSLKTLF